MNIIRIEPGQGLIKTVGLMIETAARDGADALHMRPLNNDSLEATHQKRGTFVHVGYIPRSLAKTIFFRLKILAKCRESESWRAQDGEVHATEFSYAGKNHKIPGYHVFFVPNPTGESAIVQFNKPQNRQRPST